MGTTELLMSGLLPEVASSLAVSRADAGFLITAFAIGLMVGASVSPLIAAIVRRSTVLTLALFLFAIGHVALAFGGTFEAIVVTRLFLGFTTGLFWGTAGSLVVSLVGAAASSRALGVLLSGNMLATVLGTPFATVVGHWVGWRMTFGAIGGVALVAAALYGSGAFRARHESLESLNSLRRGFAALSRWRLWLAYLSLALLQGGISASYSFLPSLVSAAAGTPLELTLAQVGYGAAAFLGLQVGGTLGWRRPVIVVVAASVCTLILAVLAAPLPVGLLIGAISLVGLSGVMCIPVLLSRVAHVSSPAHDVGVALNPAALNAGVAMGTTSAALGLAMSGWPGIVAIVGASLTLLSVSPVLVLRRADRE
jgi:DHA1 family inner membrane transport protein